MEECEEADGAVEGVGREGEGRHVGCEERYVGDLEVEVPVDVGFRQGDLDGRDVVGEDAGAGGKELVGCGDAGAAA